MSCGKVVPKTMDSPQTESDGVMTLFDDFERKLRAEDVDTSCLLEGLVCMLVKDALAFSTRLRSINSLECIGCF
jgi:hypothetical protein